jgi:hypothetical protein
MESESTFQDHEGEKQDWRKMQLDDMYWFAVHMPDGASREQPGFTNMLKYLRDGSPSRGEGAKSNLVTS